MIRLALVLWFALAVAAQAVPVLVKTGEHDGFTRLVMDFGQPVDWKVGRTDDGYQLQLVGLQPGYDLTEAFRVIGKSRLAAIWTDPESQNLRLGIACACHAIPFEFRAGIIVIDLKDGPPPKGSSFELSLNGSGSAQLVARPVPKPRPRPKMAAGAGPIPIPVGTNDAPDGMLLPLPDPALQPMRESLLRELGAGATQGLVDLTLPIKAGGPLSDAAEPPFMAVTLGELPGFAAGSGLPQHSGLAAQGQTCIPAALLDLASWADDSPVSQQMSGARAGLVGEFDAVVPDALRRAVQFNLAIGFGAEARQLLRSFPSALPEMPIWISLSYLVDEEPAPASAFAGQAGCDTPAALWAVLADPGLTPGDIIDRDAVYLAFSALPWGLRRQLGPALVERSVGLGDADLAAKIRNAVLRAPGVAGPKVDLMQARLDLATGDPATAQRRLESLLNDPGPETAAAVIALVQARTEQGLPVSTDLVTALSAVAQEIAGQPQAADAAVALVWAQAASGDFDSAFAALPDAPDAGERLWRLLAVIGQDAAVLNHAVLAADVALPITDDETRAKLAARLQNLGMADAALRWAEASDPIDPILLARIQLDRHDGRAALRALSDVALVEAYPLRAAALLQLGDPAAAASVFAAAEAPQDELRAFASAHSWQEIAARGQEPWKSAAASLALPPSPAQEGAIARGQRMADASATTQQQIAGLLAAISGP